MSKYLVLSFLLLIQCANAAENVLKISITDTNNQAVKDAVIEVIGTTPAEALSVNSPAIVDQVDKQFLPEQITIQKSQSVAFPNSDDIRHHVYSFSEAKPFEIRLYKDTPGAPITFDTAGIVVLGCNIHDSMVGYIYVADNNAVLTTNEEGVAAIRVPNHLSNQAISLRIWHKNLSVDSEKAISVTIDANQRSAEFTLALVKLPKRDTFDTLFTQ